MSCTNDSHNRLSTVLYNRLSGLNTTTFSYDSASNVTTVTYPNGAQSTFRYDTLNRFSGLSSQVSCYTYQRGPTGNLTGSTESNGHTECWSYDGIHRLTCESISLAPSQPRPYPVNAGITMPFGDLTYSMNSPPPSRICLIEFELRDMDKCSGLRVTCSGVDCKISCCPCCPLIAEIG